MSIIKATRGGLSAHIVRRAIHLSIVVAPLVYYFLLTSFFSPVVLHRSLFGFIIFILLLECIRIKNKIVVFGQRHHEASQFSAFAWTIISISLVLIALPNATFALPIIVSCALADPLVGEMRMRKIKNLWIISAGVFTVFVVWFSFAFYYHFPLWVPVVMAPITIAVEWPSLRWIDDNALMLLVPLVIVLGFFLHLL